MVGRYHVYGSVDYPLDERRSVLSRAQRRVHLEASVLHKVVLAECEIVRTRLAGDVNPVTLRPPYQLDALLCRYMADMIPTAGLLGELQIPFYLPVLAFRGYSPVTVHPRVGSVMYVSAVKKRIYLAVRGYYFPEALSLYHRAAHHILALHSPAVVRKSADVFGNAVHVGKLLALFAHSYRAVGQHPHHSVPPDYLKLSLEVLSAVRHGIQIRHCAHGGISAPRRCRRACFYRLFI